MCSSDQELENLRVIEESRRMMNGVLRKRIQILEDALRDMATFGVRHDMNPTREWPAFKGPNAVKDAIVHEYDWWQRYTAGMESYIKERARRALEESANVYRTGS